MKIGLGANCRWSRATSRSVNRAICVVVALLVAGSAVGAQSPRATEWPAYGNDAGGTRYSPAAEITSANVKDLRLAWVMRTGDFLGERGRFEATPLLVRGTLYVSTPLGSVLALDPATGAERWKYDGPVDFGGDFGDFANRGVGAWTGGRTNERCAVRIFVATVSAQPHRARRQDRRAVRRLRRQGRRRSHRRAPPQAGVSLGVRRHVAADDRRQSGDRRLGGAGQSPNRRTGRRDSRVRRAHRRAALVVRSDSARRTRSGLRDVDRTERARDRRRERLEHFLGGFGARSRLHSRRQREPGLLRR